jgi:predicted nucleotidyltransferase
MTKDELYSQVRDVLHSFPEIQLGIVYGSIASKRIRQSSDLDIAVMGTKPLSYEARLSISETLEKKVQREIDLVDLYNLHGPLLHQIFAQGKIVFKRSSKVLAFLLKRLWYEQEDMMPLTRNIMKKQLENYFYEQGRHPK